MKHIGNDERNSIKFMLGYGKKNTLSSSQRKQTLSSPIPVLSLQPVYLHHLPAYSLTLPAHPALLHHLPTHSLKLLAHPNLICHLPSQPTLLSHPPATLLHFPPTPLSYTTSPPQGNSPPKKSIRQTSFAPLRFFRKEFSSFNTSSISPRNSPTQNPIHP